MYFASCTLRSKEIDQRYQQNIIIFEILDREDKLNYSCVFYRCSNIIQGMIFLLRFNLVKDVTKLASIALFSHALSEARLLKYLLQEAPLHFEERTL